MKKFVESIFPLSPQQQGMLFESLYGSGPGLHLEQLVWVMNGDLDADLYQQAWQRTVECHASLRTAFVWKDRDEPLQAVLRRVELPLEHLDWRALEPEEQERKWQEYQATDLSRGFDLARAPLMRLTLTRTGEREHRFLWTFHHILFDGWSWPLILRDVFTFYLAKRRGEEEPRLAPSPPYRSYISWLESQDPLAAMQFWRDDLKGFSRPTPLGRTAEGQRSVAPPQEERYRTLKVSLSEETTAALAALVRPQRLTLSTLVEGIWALLLSRYSGEADVVFGTTVSGRPGELQGVESMIGLFINTLPLRLRLPAERPFLAWLDDIRRHQLGKKEHEHCSEGQIHQWCDLPASRPLYESILVYENFPAELGVLDSSDLDIELREAQFRGAFTKHTISLLVAEGPRMSVQLTHDTWRLEGADGERILEHWLAVADAIAADPHQSLGALRASIPHDQIPCVRRLAQPDLPAAGGFVAPRSATEESLAHLWAQVLDVEQVGVEDTFFDLGGHSLLAMEILKRTRETFAVELTLRHLFENPTVAGLSVVIAQKQAEKLDEEALREMLERLETTNQELASA